MISAKLDGKYGIAKGVEILPVGQTNGALPAGKSNPTGEDNSL